MTIQSQITKGATGQLFASPPRTGYWRVWSLLILPPVLLIGITTLIAVIAVIGAEGDRSVITGAINRAMPAILITNHGILFAVLLWFMRLDGMRARDIGWNITGMRPVAIEITIGVVVGMVLFIVHQYVWQPAVSWMAEGVPTYRAASNTAPLGENLAFALMVGIVLGGFVEEQLYRGYVLVRLTERLRLSVACVPMLLFFGALHFGLGWTGMLVATLTGLMLTLLFVWRRSLIAVIIAHASINIFVLVT